MRFRSLQTLLAALVAPWAAPAAVAVSISVPYSAREGFADYWAILSISLVASYIGVLLLGLPAAYFLDRLRWLNLATLAVSGALGGIAVFWLFLFLLVHVVFKSSEALFPWTLWGAPLGLFVALVFGVIGGVPLSIRRVGHEKVIKPAGVSSRRV